MTLFVESFVVSGLNLTIFTGRDAGSYALGT